MLSPGSRKKNSDGCRGLSVRNCLTVAGVTCEPVRGRCGDKMAVSGEVRDAARRESEGACVSRSSFALPVPPSEGVQRGGAPLRFFHPPRVGARGLKRDALTISSMKLT